MIPPIGLVIDRQIKQKSCSGIDFVVYAHYSLHEWLTEKFEEFKQGTKSAFDDDVCYTLQIEDSALRDGAGDDYFPTIWIPETTIWIDIAEQGFKNLGDENVKKYMKDGELLIKNRSSDCVSTTYVPFGIITWKKFADIILENINDTDVISFETILDLAEHDWFDDDNDGGESLYPAVKEEFDQVKALYLAHGHPNVTSGGLLGALVAFSSSIAADTAEKEVINFETGPPECDSQQLNEASDASKRISRLEKKIISTTPIDYTLTGFMMSRGPSYLHMAYGFESDVAILNNKFRDQLLYLWNDTLSFLYLDKTYWIEHPVCKLTGASWYNDHGNGLVADYFINWIKDSCDDTQCIADLQKFGLRPYREELNDDISIITNENGCNPFVSTSDSPRYSKADVPTAMCMRQEYQQQKKDLRLQILLDVSGQMQESVTDGESRWAAVVDSLPKLPTNLGANTQIYLTCFYEEIIPGSGCAETIYPNQTLQYDRAELINYFTNSITPRSGNKQRDVFSSLNQTYTNFIQLQEESNGYRYIILILTEEDSMGNNDDALSLLKNIGLSFTPNQIQIYPILYYPEEGEDSLTATTLQEIATRTNGQFSTATSDTLSDVLEEFAYYW